MSDQRARSVISPNTLVPLGLAASLCYIVFIAGGFYERQAAIDKLNLPLQLQSISAALAALQSDNQQIKRRLGLVVVDPANSGFPTTSTSAAASGTPRLPSGLPRPPQTIADHPE